MLTGNFKKLCLNILNHLLTFFSGEQFYSILSRLIGTKQTVASIIATTVNRLGHNFIQPVNPFSTCGLEQTLSTSTAVNITIENILGVVEYCSAVVGKDNLYLGSRLTNQIGIIFYVINTCEGMFWISKQVPPLILGQHIGIRVNAFFIKQIYINKMISYLIRWVAEHQNNLFATFGNTAQTNCKAVSAENRKDNTNGFSSKLISYICCYIVHACIVALCTSHNRLSHTDNIPISRNKSFHVHCFNNGTCYDLRQVVTLTDNRSTESH